MRQLCATRIVFVGGEREELAMVDAKLDREIKLLAGGVDQLDNNKQNIQPKCSCNEFMGTSCVLICKNLIIMIPSKALSPHKHQRRFDVRSERVRERTALNSVWFLQAQITLVRMLNTSVVDLFSPKPVRESRVGNLLLQTNAVLLNVLLKDTFGFPLSRN